jgi:hypothetical protein
MLRGTYPAQELHCGNVGRQNLKRDYEAILRVLGYPKGAHFRRLQNVHII